MNRKTYKIMKKDRFGVERIDSARGEKEANYLMAEYQMAVGSFAEIWAEDSDGNRL